MIVIRIIVTVKPKERGALLVHMKQEVAAMKQFPGCERFKLFEDVSSEDTFLLYEEWKDRTSFAAYKSSPTFEANNRTLRPMLKGSPDQAYFIAELMT